VVLKIAGGLAAVIAVFALYVSSRNGQFHYERSGIIAATPAEIYPYISEYKKGSLWSPFERKDPNMKKSYFGTDGTAGSGMEFEGNSDTGSGRLDLLTAVPNEKVEMKLTMTKPFHGENLVTYTLSPADGGTKFTWSMSGDGGFLGKLIAVFIDCEKMIGGDFSAGIANLKQLVESQKH
jgi:hypothetical protein